MKVSQMQSMLAINAALVTAAAVDVYDLCSLRRRDKYDVSIKKDIRWNRSVIKRLAAIQRTLKDDIKAARTTKRVYKKHGKIKTPAQNVARARIRGLL
jgi:hypothetical protein